MKWVLLLLTFSYLAIITKETAKIIPVLLLSYLIIERKNMSNKFLKRGLVITAFAGLIVASPEFLMNLILKGKMVLGQYWFSTGISTARLSFEPLAIMANSSLQSTLLLIALPSPLILFSLYSMNIPFKIKRITLTVLFIIIGLIVAYSFPIPLEEIPVALRRLVSFGGWTLTMVILLKIMIERKYLLGIWFTFVFVALSTYQNLIQRLDILIPVLIPTLCILLIQENKIVNRKRLKIIGSTLLIFAILVQASNIQYTMATFRTTAILSDDMRVWLDDNLPDGSIIMVQLTRDDMFSIYYYFNATGRLEIIGLGYENYEKVIDAVRLSHREAYLLTSTGTTLDEYVTDKGWTLERIHVFHVNSQTVTLDPVKIIYRNGIMRTVVVEHELFRVIG